MRLVLFCDYCPEQSRLRHRKSLMDVGVTIAKKDAIERGSMNSDKYDPDAVEARSLLGLHQAKSK